MKNILRSRTAAVVAGATVLAGFGGIGVADAATGHLPWNSRRHSPDPQPLHPWR